MSFKLTSVFKNNTDEAARDILSKVDVAVKKSARLMERNIKQSATTLIYQSPQKRNKSGKPLYLRTGHLRRGVLANDNLPPGEGEVRISPTLDGADTNYAAYVEYGTSRQPAKPFIRTGVAASEKQITQIFNDELKK